MLGFVNLPKKRDTKILKNCKRILNQEYLIFILKSLNFVLESKHNLFNEKDS